MFDREAIKTLDCKDEVVNLCSELVQIPSENPPGNVADIAFFIKHYLENNGFTVQTLSSTPNKINVVGKLEFSDEGQTLVLNGHMDVVPAGDKDRWSFDPFCGKREGDYILGRGASDMKGGLAALLVALKHAAKWDIQRGKVLFMAVPDEETGGEYGTQWLLEKGFTGDACLIAEPSGICPTIGQKGSLWLRITAHGHPAHGSLSPVVGDNAIMKMASVLQRIVSLWERDWSIPFEIQQLIDNAKRIIKKEAGDDPARVLDRVTVNVGKIQGGEKINMVPSHCEAELDLRIPIGVQTSTVFHSLSQLIRQHFRDGIEVTPIFNPFEATFTRPDHSFVKLVLKAIREVTRKDSQPVLQWASSDARYFRYRAIPTIQFGPADLEGIHSYNEKVHINALVDACRIYALIMHDFLLP